MGLRLVWETDEWDPIAGMGSSEDEDTDSELTSDVERRANKSTAIEKRKKRDKARWTQREEELVDGTKDVGFWIGGKEARVRIELR